MSDPQGLGHPQERTLRRTMNRWIEPATYGMVTSYRNECNAMKAIRTVPEQETGREYCTSFCACLSVIPLRDTRAIRWRSKDRTARKLLQIRRESALECRRTVRVVGPPPTRGRQSAGLRPESDPFHRCRLSDRGSGFPTVDVLQRRCFERGAGDERRILPHASRGRDRGQRLPGDRALRAVVADVDDRREVRRCEA